MQSGAACRSVRNLVKTSSLPLSKLRQVLHSKPTYTKFILACRKFKRIKAFARFKVEVWYKNRACVDKLANDKNVVNYLLVHQDRFHRTVDAKGMKTKDSKETVRALLTISYRYKKPTHKNLM